MKNRTLVLVTVAALTTLAFAPVGCTSLLGDYEVASKTDTPADSGGSCTLCDGVCVDTQTSTAHCGQCGKACVQGQSCTAGTCTCPAETSAVCGGQCVKADRAHCGPSCAVCQADEVCATTGCTPAAQPGFESTPLETTGWLDPAGNPIGFKIKPTGVPGTVYECRSGPAAEFTPTVPAWKSCDDGDGSQPRHAPKPKPDAQEGTYRTEYRYRSDTYRSATVSHVYYVHRSLDKVATCPRAGHPEDGPKFTDAQYFQSAANFSAANAAVFPTVAVFPQPSFNRTDPLVIQNPFIKIPFTNVAVSAGMIAVGGWPSAGGDYLMNERSLRHKYAMNATRTMILVRRQYVHPKDGDCTNDFWIGSKRAASQFGPASVTRGHRRIDCEALVLNTRGAAICMGRNPAGTMPIPRRIDQVPNRSGVDGLHGYPLPQTATVAPSSSTVTLSAGVNLNGSLVQIPGADATTAGGYWYKVTAVAGATLTITPAYKGFAQSGVKVRYHPDANLVDVFDIPTGYAKLHEDSHAYATGARAPNTPSPRTKCETPGCNAGKPWLTFLPP